jgi:DNA-directed RNA polymerase subunit RPC12/RpoP
VSYTSGNYDNLAAPVLGLGLAFIIAAPLVGVGVFLLIKGRREAAEFAEVEKERKLLGMVQAQGQVGISDVALELDASRDQVKEWVYDLVHKGLFAGYINWDEGTLYSRDASQLRGNKCPNCGGEVELAGKDVIQCPYCGAEIFLTG